MAKELKLRTDEFERAVGRLIATSRRDRSVVMQGQMKGILKTVGEITPPGSEGVKGGTRAAQKQGEATVVSDIRRVYGTAGDAYELLAAESKAKASAFWLLSHQGDEAGAHRVLYDATGKSFSAFDGGKLHKSMVNKRGRVGAAQQPVFFVRTSDEKSLDAYIKEKQDHVYWLSAGWKKALTTVGGQLPAMIGKHNAPGAIDFIVEAMRMTLRAHNDVKFASHIGDFERRIQWALDRQTEKIIRQWDFWVKQQAIKQNFKTS